MLHPKENHTRRWTVDLALGRRWWLLPLAALLPLASARLFAQLYGSNTSGILAPPRDWVHCLILAGISGSAYAAATLLSRGARLQHYVCGTITAAAGGALCAPGYLFWPHVTLLTSLAVCHVLILRAVGWPRWRVRPSRARGTGTSLRYLLAFTAAIALALAAAMRLMPQGLLHGTLMAVAWLFFWVLPSQLFGSLWHVNLSRAFGLLLLLAIAVPLALEIHRGPFQFRPVTAFAIYMPLLNLPVWAICHLHRSRCYRPG